VRRKSMRRTLRVLWSFVLFGVLVALSGGCARVSIETDPPGAKLYQNGKYIGTSPYIGDFFVPEGIGSLTAAVLPGYTLEDCPPIAKGAAGLGTSMAFTSAPAGALCYKDGQYVGTSPGYDPIPSVPRSLRVVWPKEVLQSARLLNPKASSKITNESAATIREKAITWRAASARPPLSEAARLARARAEKAFHQHKFENAIVCYEEGLDIEPMWPQGHFNAACLCAEMGLYQAAVLHMECYLAMLPNASNATSATTQIRLWTQRVKG
jgi:hypothetical protein